MRIMELIMDSPKQTQKYEEGFQMKKIFIIASILVFCLIFSVDFSSGLRRGDKQVQIPIGTKIEKEGNVTRFLLEDGVLEVIGTKGELLVKAYDKQGKLIYTGKQGKIYRGKTNEQIPISKIRAKVTIDDDITWIKFSSEPTGR
jgi:hypothetical protein